MKILVFEDNLIWSSRLLQGIRGLGHEPVLLKAVPEDFQEADAAIVNLSSPTMPVEDILPALRGTGIFIIGHAGHKENPLWEKGREAGCDTVVSNSTITHKLADVLNAIPQ
jgi:hypothetical protein